MCMDLKTYHIRNSYLIFSVLIISGYTFFEKGAMGLLEGLLSMVVVCLLLLPVFCFSVIGAADVKIFIIMSCYLGYQSTLLCFCYSLLIGAVFSLIKMLYHRNLLTRLLYFGKYIKNCMEQQKILPYHTNGIDQKAVIHYTVPIFLGLMYLQLGGTIWLIQ